MYETAKELLQPHILMDFKQSTNAQIFREVYSNR